MGEWMDKAREKLREEHYRLTRQREIICGVFAEYPDRHFTAEEIRDVAEGDRALGLATVYRTLAVLEEVGLIRRVDIGDGIARYEYAAEDSRPHCHLICLECGAVREIEWPALEDVGEMLGVDDFEITDQSLIFYGTCPECRAKAESNAEEKSREGGDDNAER
ncbi:MAG: Fur family transcriptional regulator [Bacillota bacterium]